MRQESLRAKSGCIIQSYSHRAWMPCPDDGAYHTVPPTWLYLCFSHMISKKKITGLLNRWLRDLLWSLLLSLLVAVAIYRATQTIRNLKIPILLSSQQHRKDLLEVCYKALWSSSLDKDTAGYFLWHFMKALQGGGLWLKLGTDWHHTEMIAGAT